MSWLILSPPNSHYETLRGLQSSLPFGKGSQLTVPVIGMPTSMSKVTSLRHAVLGKPENLWILCWGGKSNSFLLSHIVIMASSSLLNSSQCEPLFPETSPVPGLYSFLFPNCPFLPHPPPPFPPAPQLNTPGKANASFCPSCKIKLLEKHNQRQYVPEGIWRMGELIASTASGFHLEAKMPWLANKKETQ